MDDNGSESSVEVLRGQYSIDTAYEESREGLSQLSHLTPVNGEIKTTKMASVGIDFCFRSIVFFV